ncbi:16S rRNA (adenine(1518)-N(6)/adenine(1519)-N(6))-dimethyltransferase RsmA [Pseudomonadota bacterium]
MSKTTQGHRARKRFGQNFLHDQNVIQRIVSSVNPQPGQRLVEIGPGLGAITELLLDASGQLDVVELDRDLVERLEKRFGGNERFRIHSGDALKFDFFSLMGEDGEKLRVVGNLPYNISTPLLFHLMDQLDCIKDIHCMLQKEVVERMTAEPGSSHYGRLSVMLQYHCQPLHLFNVGPGAFSPAPKVDSAVARLVPHKTRPVTVSDEAIFAKTVSQAFSQRRKTLRNCLKNYLTTEEIESAEIDPTIRPERLTLDEFARLSNIAAAKSEAE